MKKIKKLKSKPKPKIKNNETVKNGTIIKF